MEGEKRRRQEDRERGKKVGRERERRESFFGEKWKFNQISFFYSANRKSVLIKPKEMQNSRLRWRLC